MANSAFFKRTFDALAHDDCIGQPNGQLAYAYIRVSDSEQAEDGRSGLSRQIEHIHEAAKRDGYKIPWELVFADDFSGFVFEDRPALTELRREINSGHKRAEAVIIEHLDRLSRNADWHQGFLLDEMYKHGIKVIFWKSFSSRVERAVMGAIAQDGMENAKRRMMEGNIHKAKSGRVTARVAAYGYKLVDSDGQEGPAAKTDTHYAIKESEAKIIRLIFSKVLSGVPLRRIAIDLQMAGYPPPKKYKNWHPTQVRLFIKNEIYKGDFYAHRWKHVTEEVRSEDGLSTRKVKRKRERPRDEWIHVPVPAIVSPEEWDEANQILEKNKRMARRNAAKPFLLTGLVRCVHCGRTFNGTTSRRGRGGKPRKTPYRGYRCPYKSTLPSYMREHVECKNSQLRCEILDGVVWEIVSTALLEPEVLLQGLDTDDINQRNDQLQAQISFLEGELKNRADGDDKLLKAYMAGAFDEHEYAASRNMLKQEVMKLEQEILRLRSAVVPVEQLEQRKALVLNMAKQIREQGILLDPPFDLKQRIIKLVVDEIILDVQNEWLQVKGVIRGTFPIVKTPVDTD